MFAEHIYNNVDSFPWIWVKEALENDLLICFHPSSHFLSTVYQPGEVIPQMDTVDQF